MRISPDPFTRLRPVATALVILLMCVAPLSHATCAGADVRQLGVNIGAPDWVNMMKGGYFAPITPNATLSFDPAGWPLGDSRLVVYDARVNMPWNGPDPVAVPIDLSGTYLFSCTGKVEIEPGAEISSGLTVEKLVYQSASNTTTANIVLAPDQSLFVINLKNTDGGVKNIRIIRPGYGADTKEVITAAYLKAVKPFAVIRIKDLMGIDVFPIFDAKGTLDYEWSMRRLPADATQFTVGAKVGAAVEYGVLIANANNQDIWVSIPVCATDDYVRHLAELLHKQLKPNLHIYVEYGSEDWNFAFKAAIWDAARSKAEIAAGNSILNSDGETHDYVWLSRFQTRRVIQISKIFQQEYGAGSLGARVRPVLVWQCGSQDMVRQMLTWAKANFGDPKQYIWGVGDGMYYTPTDFTSVDSIIRTMDANGAGLKADTIAFATLAHDFGMHRVVYEGGTGGDGAGDLDKKLAANRDPRMTESVHRYLMDSYFNAGGEVFCYYGLNNAYGPYGNFGLVDRDVTKLNSPKYKGAMETLADLNKAAD